MILLRKDPPSTWNTFIPPTCKLAETQGARFNKPQAIRDHNELATGAVPNTSPTLVTRDAAACAPSTEHQDVILKPLDGMGGTGIFRVRQDGLNLGSIIETLTDNGQRTIMIQRFIPEIVAGDKRVLVIGGKVVPYSLARIPQGSEVRGNLAAGGIGVAQPLTVRDREIGEALGPVLSQRGLLLVGLDVIGDYLTESTSPAQLAFRKLSSAGLMLPRCSLMR